MKNARLRLFTCLCFVLSSAPAVWAGTLEKISAHVYAYHGIENASAKNSFGANTGVIVGQKGVLVVDTRATAAEAEDILQEVRAMTPLPVLYAVNTHFHFDHSLGNCTFQKAGATILSHEKCRQAMIGFGDRVFEVIRQMGMTDEMLTKTTLAFPEITFAERMRIDLGGIGVELIYLAPSHSPGGILVRVAEDRVLFSGDIMFADFHAYLATADLAGWKKNLDAILEMAVDHIIPGHGPLCGKQAVSDQLLYLTEFDRLGTLLAEEGKSLDTAVSEITQRLPEKSQGAWMIRSNLVQRYLKAKP